MAKDVALCSSSVITPLPVVHQNVMSDISGPVTKMYNDGVDIDIEWRGLVSMRFLYLWFTLARCR